MQTAANAQTWDIFCTVIDNYGDIGVTWRLARQLQHEHGQQVRLWVDDLHAFSRLCPSLTPQKARQIIDGIDIRQWLLPFPDKIVPGDIVLDAFGCSLPDNFIQTMANKSRQPLWINLEYLTAEDWVDCCHGMQSPHPRVDLTRHFFFPGFSQRSGGILIEKNTIPQARAWQEQTPLKSSFFERLGLPPYDEKACYVSLFSYENPAIIPLLKHWAAGSRTVHCLVPEGKILPSIAQAFAIQSLVPGHHFDLGGLKLHILAFSDPKTYDQLLWSCDLNIVRGEDSFVRAQLAGKPMVWHIYPQEDAAHWVKLDAFLNRYLHGTTPSLRQAVSTLNHAWNHGQEIVAAWEAANTRLPQWKTHAVQWQSTLARQDDLVARLMHFISEHQHGTPAGK